MKNSNPQSPISRRSFSSNNDSRDETPKGGKWVATEKYAFPNFGAQNEAINKFPHILNPYVLKSLKGEKNKLHQSQITEREDEDSQSQTTRNEQKDLLNLEEVAEEEPSSFSSDSNDSFHFKLQQYNNRVQQNVIKIGMYEEAQKTVDLNRSFSNEIQILKGVEFSKDIDSFKSFEKGSLKKISTIGKEEQQDFLSSISHISRFSYSKEHSGLGALTRTSRFDKSRTHEFHHKDDPRNGTGSESLDRRDISIPGDPKIWGKNESLSAIDHSGGNSNALRLSSAKEPSFAYTNTNRKDSSHQRGVLNNTEFNQNLTNSKDRQLREFSSLDDNIPKGSTDKKPNILLSPQMRGRSNLADKSSNSNKVSNSSRKYSDPSKMSLLDGVKEIQNSGENRSMENKSDNKESSEEKKINSSEVMRPRGLPIIEEKAVEERIPSYPDSLRDRKSDESRRTSVSKPAEIKSKSSELDSNRNQSRKVSADTHQEHSKELNIEDIWNFDEGNMDEAQTPNKLLRAYSNERNQSANTASPLLNTPVRYQALRIGSQVRGFTETSTATKQINFKGDIEEINNTNISAVSENDSSIFSQRRLEPPSEFDDSLGKTSNLSGISMVQKTMMNITLQNPSKFIPGSNDKIDNSLQNQSQNENQNQNQSKFKSQFSFQGAMNSPTNRGFEGEVSPSAKNDTENSLLSIKKQASSTSLQARSPELGPRKNGRGLSPSNKDLAFGGTFSKIPSHSTVRTREDLSDRERHDENEKREQIKIPIISPTEPSYKEPLKIPIEPRRKSVNFNAETPKSNQPRKGGFEEKLLMQRVMTEISFSRNTNL